MTSNNQPHPSEDSTPPIEHSSSPSPTPNNPDGNKDTPDRRPSPLSFLRSLKDGDPLGLYDNSDHSDNGIDLNSLRLAFEALEDEQEDDGSELGSTDNETVDNLHDEPGAWYPFKRKEVSVVAPLFHIEEKGLCLTYLIACGRTPHHWQSPKSSFAGQLPSNTSNYEDLRPQPSTLELIE
ncbi:uncharacterized protein MELLADRAFT_108163 [Melampsora larici-populina 98AG31]|uniref:Uncharacterized protein n=1 Tax=Melampsora larici-populina (strain 98AG31 / pathotype 3-4-7) TaxID=747676 RepID=F4RS64_MELLP|nr:uncharacterized protein MELLADRAFT_108163 [Melampsora larici-populina 98AG31]EGG04801.1 hypothetical protein MELLADRAFT_108163 [Melampsora larici-populina 98AG31]